jgi:hypothetical protein
VPLVEHELLNFPDHLSSHLVFCGVRVTRSLVFCVVFCRLMFDLLSFFFWPLCCLSFYDLQILIALLVFSNFFFEIRTHIVRASDNNYKWMSIVYFWRKNFYFIWSVFWIYVPDFIFELFWRYISLHHIFLMEILWYLKKTT